MNGRALEAKINTGKHEEPALICRVKHAIHVVAEE